MLRPLVASLVSVLVGLTLLAGATRADAGDWEPAPGSPVMAAADISPEVAIVPARSEGRVNVALSRVDKLRLAVLTIVVGAAVAVTAHRRWDERSSPPPGFDNWLAHPRRGPPPLPSAA